MSRILGIDTGTNSLGWAIVEKVDGVYHLVDQGVHIFQEGVKIEKGQESSRAAERTGHRAQRIGYYRTKLRKIHLLRVLSDAGLCPPLSPQELSAWRQGSKYPENEAFRRWQATDDVLGINPYAYRHRCLHEPLDMSDIAQRYILGRALYHLAQRRGFLSNRKEDSESEEDGAVKSGISRLTVEMNNAGVEYLGDYFYSLYQEGKRIRCHYTARNEHYLHEFRAICAQQGIGAELEGRLCHAIFYQRPLKSQKHTVGKCTLETKKPKCQTSHPLYEEFRMLSFVNNVRVQSPHDDALRPLTGEERQKVQPLFYRKSKPNFPFSEIADKIAGKKNYCYYKSREQRPWRFNYYPDTSVAGCPVTAQLRGIFGEEWADGICAVYTLSKGKTRLQIINDIWHALTFYDDEERLAGFARTRLQLDEKEAEQFARIRMPQPYARLSLRAITRILPLLRRGMIYSHAVFLANLGQVVPAYLWEVADVREGIIEGLEGVIREYDPRTDSRTLEFLLCDYLRSRYVIDDRALTRLYHPSATDLYPRARQQDDGTYRLGSPRTDSVRNPMAMHSLFRLRCVINQLLGQRLIDEDTEVHIEFGRELNDANKRSAIQQQNRNLEKQHAESRTRIRTLYRETTGREIEPTDTDILKYELWEEQQHICLYTGQLIGLADFLGTNPRFDIEHTIPRSAGGDSTRMNLTLCDSRYNREVKRTHLPATLPGHEERMMRIHPWLERCEALDKQIRKLNTSGASDKEVKDRIIQKRHRLILERDYWRGKCQRFEMTEVPEGFSRRQGVDASVITRLGLAYLKTVFRHVYTRKGIATSDFRKIWGIQDIYDKKQRVNHTHHCIDAIVIACMGREQYDQLAAYYHDEEEHRWYGRGREHMEKPWPTFTEDMRRIADHVAVAHYTADNMAKQGRRRIAVGSRRILSQGDAARGSLHLDTNYGAIDRGDGVKYVVRRPLANLTKADVDKIVDDTVRAIIQRAIDQGGIEALKGEIWMNEEKRIAIKRVRCYAPSVKRPICIRQHRDQSAKEYKRQYYVTNDRNYLMAIYIGHGRREFLLVNMLQAAAHYRASRHGGGPLVPATDAQGQPLAYTLRIGTMVLLYEKTPDEVWQASQQERVRRLYKVTGLSSMIVGNNGYGVVTLVYHQEARPSSEIKIKKGKYKVGEELRPSIGLLHTQFDALIEGRDFTIDALGHIHPITP